MLKLMRRSFLVAFVAMCFAQIAHAETFKVDGAFEIEKISEPKIVPAPAGDAKIWVMERGDENWAVAFVESQIPRDLGIYLGYAEEVARNLGGKVTKNEIIVDANGIRCVESEIEFADSKMVGRSFAVGLRLYDVSFDGPKTTSVEEIKRFLDSFRILN